MAGVGGGITGRGIGAGAGVGVFGVCLGVDGRDADLVAEGIFTVTDDFDELCVGGETGLVGAIGAGILSIFLGILTPCGCWPAFSLARSSLIVRMEDWYSLGADGVPIPPVPLGDS